MKLIPPEPQVNLYIDGFEDNDILQRKQTGAALSDLLNQIDDPLVVALNGQWGTGKTYFLKRWVGTHLKNYEGVTILYFDAFAHDYLGDPLSALTSALEERAPPDNAKALVAVKAAAVTLARPIMRAGLAAATAGATEMFGNIGGAVAGSLASETDGLLQKKFWEFEKNRRAAMTEFRAAMETLAQPADDSRTGATVIFVIDELDRCRPDYALELLEVIKHFFAVPRLHFVLGVNLDALEEMVRTRYGVGIDAHRYLSKFIQIRLELPDEVNDDYHRKTILKYFNHLIEQMGITHDIAGPLQEQIEIVARDNPVSLRDIGSIVSTVALACPAVLRTRKNSAWIEVMNTLIIAKTVRPDLYPGFLTATVTSEDIQSYLSTHDDELMPMLGNVDKEFRQVVQMIYNVWLFLSQNRNFRKNQPDEYEAFHRQFNPHGRVNDLRSIPMTIHRIWLDRFSFYNSDQP